MSLSDLAALGSFVSGVAVLISLVFLYFQLRQIGVQVRQAERNQRATIAAVRASRTTEGMLSSCEPTMADAFTKASSGDPDLTITEWQQYNALARAIIVNAEDTFAQHRNNLMEENAWRTYVALFGHTSANAAFRVAWRRFGRASASPEFAAFADQVMAQTPVTKLPSAPEILATWRSDFAELTAPAATLAAASS